MAYQKEGEDIVINGWDKGIAVSPLKGIANLSGVNIATESGEVMCSFSRRNQLSSASSSGTATYASATTISLAPTSSTTYVGQWITIGSGIGGLSAGVYFVSGETGGNYTLNSPLNSVSYAGTAVSGLSAGSATFSVSTTLSSPIASATENYNDTSYNPQQRYYVLDSAGLLWVYDTGNGFPARWFCPCTAGFYVMTNGLITTSTTAGLAVLNGWIGIVVGNNIYWKPTSNLGATPLSSYPNMLMSDIYSKNPHTAFVGHQNIMYYADGNFIGSIFPDSSVISLNSNIQSYCSYTISSTYQGNITALINGSMPSFGANSSNLVPAIFYAAEGGTLPTGLQANTIYWIQFPYVSTSAGTTEFYVYKDIISPTQQIDISTGSSGTTFYFNTFNPVQQSAVNASTAMAFTGGVSSGSTSGTLTATFTGVTGTYTATFSDGEVRTVTLTNGATTITWSSGLSNNVTAYFQVVLGGSNFVYGAGTILTMTAGVNSGATSGTLENTFPYATGVYSVTFSDGDVRTVAFANGATTMTWTTGLTGNVTAYVTALVGQSTYTFTPQRLSLPDFETSQSFVEIGQNLLIGCTGNIVYPWNQIDPKPSDLIFLPESNVPNMITVNNMAYIFAGNKGNIYISNGSAASAVISVPDYCAGVPSVPQSYVEPYFVWGGAMYLRGRVYFSIADSKNGSSTGNCGGIWSFIPTQNLFYGQDVGLSLRQENQASYGTYNGSSPLFIPEQNQKNYSPQYWNVWNVSSTYGIDVTGSGTVLTQTGIIETDLIPLGTLLEKKTLKQIEYKFSSPLLAGETIAINYRTNSTDAWTSLGTAVTDVYTSGATTSLSGYYPAPFEKAQWIQLQVILTPQSSSTGSFCRLVELRLR